ncbi:MAG: DUF424 family protein [Candidatus Aenigmarchaeota archaeon]|nr:DUF424 family protein [Candidatus Aenigmarchaeota archaeon]
MFYYSVFKSGGDVLVAICDGKELGRKIPFGKIVFEVKKDFYGSKKCKAEEVVKIVRDATIINAVGREIIELLIKEGYIDEENVMKIGDTLHAQMVTL